MPWRPCGIDPICFINRKNTQKVSVSKRIKGYIWSNGRKDVFLSENYFLFKRIDHSWKD